MYTMKLFYSKTVVCMLPQNMRYNISPTERKESQGFACAFWRPAKTIECGSGVQLFVIYYVGLSFTLPLCPCHKHAPNEPEAALFMRTTTKTTQKQYFSCRFLKLKDPFVSCRITHVLLFLKHYFASPRIFSNSSVRPYNLQFWQMYSIWVH